MGLSGKQRRHLRGLGHALDPVVQLGKDGMSDALVAQAGEQLLAHELIKLKIGQNASVDRHDAAAELATRTGAELVQVIGNTMLLYRAHPDEPTIDLPTPAKAKAAAKAAAKADKAYAKGRAKVKAKKDKKKAKAKAKAGQ